jgi:hypothetical protein
MFETSSLIEFVSWKRIESRAQAVAALAAATRRMLRLHYAGAAPRCSQRSMATVSSASSASRRIRPFIPTIPCPDCCRVSSRGVFGMAVHDGWVYYKCRNHGVIIFLLPVFE